MLGVTLLLGIRFLGLKGIEYSKDFHQHLVPALDFQLASNDRPGMELFFVLYFLATGLHTTHVTAGVCLMGVADGPARPPALSPPLRHAGGARRSVLACRGHRIALPLSPALPSARA